MELDSTLKKQAPHSRAEMEKTRKLTDIKTTEDAKKFYTTKVEELGANLKDLEAIIQGKANNLRVVEDGELPTATNSTRKYG